MIPLIPTLFICKTSPISPSFWYQNFMWKMSQCTITISILSFHEDMHVFGSLPTKYLLLYLWHECSSEWQSLQTLAFLTCMSVSFKVLNRANTTANFSWQPHSMSFLAPSEMCHVTSGACPSTLWGKNLLTLHKYLLFSKLYHKYVAFYFCIRIRDQPGSCSSWRLTRNSRPRAHHIIFFDLEMPPYYAQRKMNAQFQCQQSTNNILAT